MSSKLVLPCLRGKIGDWYYYVTLMNFREVASRVSMADEIHESRGLSKLIQREVSKRTEGITEYLITQEQRFFNSLILGIYGGSPTWQELDILKGEFEEIEETELTYLSSTFGILTLDGNEKIFAIDGQHRTKAIKDAIDIDKNLNSEEIAAIFVAHKTDREGLVRTRRLFSTLNRYAKPVSKSEIIALDEEDNCAIVTRMLVDQFELFKGKILFNKNRSISISNKTAFTNIIVLYDIATLILTDKLKKRRYIVDNIEGKKYDSFIKKRASDEVINLSFSKCKSIFNRISKKIPSLREFFYDGEQIDRKNKKTSLLFRPIGQDIFFRVLKVGIDNNQMDKVVDFFSVHDFSLNNPTWNRILYDEEVGRIKPERTIQNYVTMLFLMKLGYQVNLTEKYKEIYENYGIDPVTL